MNGNIGKVLVLYFICFINIACFHSTKIEVIQCVRYDDYNIVLFVKDVGATSDYSTHISVLKDNDMPTNKGKGNLFIAKGISEVTIEYDKDMVSVTHSFKFADIFLSENEKYGISFCYSHRKSEKNQIMDASEGDTWQTGRNAQARQTPRAAADKINKTYTPFSTKTKPDFQARIDFSKLQKKERNDE